MNIHEFISLPENLLLINKETKEVQPKCNWILYDVGGVCPLQELVVKLEIDWEYAK